MQDEVERATIPSEKKFQDSRWQSAILDYIIGGIMNQIIKIAWDLNETTENRYQLVYEIAELAKKLVDENRLKKGKEEYSFEETSFDTSIKKENPVEHAIMVKASEYDDSGLVG